MKVGNDTIYKSNSIDNNFIIQGLIKTFSIINTDDTLEKFEISLEISLVLLINDKDVETFNIDKISGDVKINGSRICEMNCEGITFNKYGHSMWQTRTIHNDVNKSDIIQIKKLITKKNECKLNYLGKIYYGDNKNVQIDFNYNLPKRELELEINRYLDKELEKFEITKQRNIKTDIGNIGFGDRQISVEIYITNYDQYITVECGPSVFSINNILIPFILDNGLYMTPGIFPNGKGEIDNNGTGVIRSYLKFDNNTSNIIRKMKGKYILSCTIDLIITDKNDLKYHDHFPIKLSKEIENTDMLFRLALAYKKLNYKKYLTYLFILSTLFFLIGGIIFNIDNVGWQNDILLYIGVGLFIFILGLIVEFFINKKV